MEDVVIKIKNECEIIIKKHIAINKRTYTILSNTELLDGVRCEIRCYETTNKKTLFELSRTVHNGNGEFTGDKLENAIQDIITTHQIIKRFDECVINFIGLEKDMHDESTTNS